MIWIGRRYKSAPPVQSDERWQGVRRGWHPWRCYGRYQAATALSLYWLVCLSPIAHPSFTQQAPLNIRLSVTRTPNRRRVNQSPPAIRSWARPYSVAS